MLVFVADYSNNRVQVFNGETGARIRFIGKQGANDGDFNGPISVAVREIKAPNRQVQLYVGENSGNHRVSIFDALTGNFIGKLGNGNGAGEGQFHGMYGVSF